VFIAKNIANFEQYAFQDIPENDGKTDDEPSCEMCEAIDIYSFFSSDLAFSTKLLIYGSLAFKPHMDTLIDVFMALAVLLSGCVLWFECEDLLHF
jgi:hypothetical protein